MPDDTDSRVNEQTAEALAARVIAILDDCSILCDELRVHLHALFHTMEARHDPLTDGTAARVAERVNQFEARVQALALDHKKD